MVSRVPVALSIALLSGFCLLFHELAHALIAVCCGGRIQEFVLLSVTPHGPVGLAVLFGLRRHDHRDEPRNIDNTGPSGLR